MTSEKLLTDIENIFEDRYYIKYTDQYLDEMDEDEIETLSNELIKRFCTIKNIASEISFMLIHDLATVNNFRQLSQFR